MPFRTTLSRYFTRRLAWVTTARSSWPRMSRLRSRSGSAWSSIYRSINTQTRISSPRKSRTSATSAWMILLLVSFDPSMNHRRCESLPNILSDILRRQHPIPAVHASVPRALRRQLADALAHVPILLRAGRLLVHLALFHLRDHLIVHPRLFWEFLIFNFFLPKTKLVGRAKWRRRNEICYCISIKTSNRIFTHIIIMSKARSLSKQLCEKYFRPSRVVFGLNLKMFGAFCCGQIRWSVIIRHGSVGLF